MLVVEGIVLTNSLVLHNFNKLHFSRKITSGDLFYHLYHSVSYHLQLEKCVVILDLELMT